MTDEEDVDGRSETPEEEKPASGSRKVRPLFRFMRRGGDEADEQEPGPEDEELAEDEGDRPRVTPVRVVKLVPTVTGEEQGDLPVEEEPTSPEDEAALQGQEEALDVAFAEVPEEEGTAAEGTAFVETETPLTEEAPFTEVVETTEGATGVVEDEASIVEGEGVDPEVPLAVIEEEGRKDVVEDTISEEEEAEMSEEDFHLRDEETPVAFERQPRPEGVPGDDARGDGTPSTGIPAIPMEEGEEKEARPHYHKYLKPDDELLERKQARGRPTGFDRDLDADAGEIDLGIDLIDPSERKRRKAPPKKPSKEPRTKKGVVGGHDFDAEVDTKGQGIDIGVDYERRRKRRL